MIENIILGFIQGVGEWLPISSEGLITLVGVNFFGALNIGDIIRVALFLHLGTFFAALIYLRKEVWQIIKSIFQYKKSSLIEKKTLSFLIIATFISGGIGFLLFSFISSFEETSNVSGQVITFFIGFLLILTAWLQLKKNKKKSKNLSNLSFLDGLTVGIAQGLTVLPGLSRSGLTVSTFLLRGFDNETSLKLSFLMSLPVVLAGNIILNLEYLYFSINSLIGLIVSFLFGILTIHFLLKIARKINMGLFVLFFGVLMILAAFL